MTGAIIGDIAGSVYEWGNIKTKDFPMLGERCRFTDDTVMTIAVADALLKDGSPAQNAVRQMQLWGRIYPSAGYGRRFKAWINAERPEPYGSWGNGSAMRVSPVGWAAGSLEEAIGLSREVTRVTHDHPEGIKGAEATAVAIYLARTGRTIPEIRAHIEEKYYPLAFTLDGIRPAYKFDVSCQGSVPQAIEAFLESVSFEDAIRNAISLGGDSDTIAAITGGIAEAYYGVPDGLREKAMRFLSDPQKKVIGRFEEKYGRK